jgi:hypothetical protein
MVLLGDVGQVEAHCGPFQECSSQRKIGAQFALNVPWARKLFWVQPVEVLGDVGQMEPHFSLFRDSVNLDTT